MYVFIYKLDINPVITETISQPYFLLSIDLSRFYFFLCASVTLENHLPNSTILWNGCYVDNFDRSVNIVDTLL